jgi:TP901 family phage tail tape measure protein
VALSRDIVIRLLGDADSAIKAQKAAADAAEVTVQQYRKAEREFDKQQKAMEVASRKQRQAMQDVGQAALGFGVAAAAGLGMAAKAAISWESSWAGVTKTVEGAPKQLAAVETGLRDLARTLPATHQEIAAVAEAAGQLGVETDSVVAFTRTMVDLGETTNLTADEAATSLAQLMNVMQTAPEDVGRLGAALVALGNDGASTEADIVKMASYLTGTAALIGASESDVLALANSLTSMGINAERGGGVMTRTMQDIYSAVQNGGDALEGFADAAGMSSAEFARAFEADPIRAIGAFTDGLATAKDRGDNVVGMLADLGIKGTQDTAVLLQMASAQGMVNKNLDLGSKAWADNTALVEEAAKRYDTTEAKIAIARNNITEAGIEIGETLLPVLASVAESVASVAQWFADLPGPVKEVLAALGSVAAVGGLVGGAFLLLAPRVADTFRAFRDLQSTMPGVAGGLGKVGKAAGVAGAIIAVAHAANALAESFGPAPSTMEETTAALLEMGTTMESVNALFNEGDGGWGSAGMHGLADAAERLTDPGLINRFDDFTAELLSLGGAEGRDQRERVIGQLGQMGQSLGFLVESGNAELAAQQFEMLTAEWERGGGTVEELRDLMPAYTEALAGVKNEQKLAAESAQRQAENTALLAEDLTAAYGSIEGYAAALGYSEDATKELIKRTQELGQSLAGFIDPLGVYTGMLAEKKAAEEEAARVAAEKAGEGADAWEQFVVDTGFSFDEYMSRLREQVEAQDNWQTNMLILAGRVSQGTLDELARMGPEGAPLVADLVNRSDAELDEFDDIAARRSKEATDAWGAQLTMAAPVLAAIGKTAGAGVVAELAAQLEAGTTTVAEIARKYGINLAGGINPVLKSLGKPGVNISSYGYNSGGGYAGGGYTGPGGKYDPAGIVHAGEYVLTKEQTDRLGIGRIEEFANRGYATGGFVTPADVPRPRSTAPYQPPISSGADATMQAAYEGVLAWLDENVGTAGSGSIPGAYQQMFALIKAAFPDARLNSGFRPGDPGYHGRGKAIDLGQVGRAGGAGHPYLAAMNRWIHDRYGASSAELIYTGAGDDRPDIKNGRPLNYGPATNAAHRDHVHWASYRTGTPYVPRDGLAYLHQGERVVPAEYNRPMPRTPVGSGATNVVVEARVFVGNREITDIARVEATAVLDAYDRDAERNGRSNRA